MPQPTPAGASWGDHQITEMAPVDSLSFQLIECSLLIGMWPQIEEHRRSRILATWTLPRIFQRLLYTTTEGFIIGPECFKLFIAPKGIKRTPETLDNMWRFDFAELDGPFDSIFESGPGKISRANIDAAETIVPLKEPGLGVQTAPAAIEGDAQFNVGKPRQFFNCAEICGSYIGGRQQPDRNISFGEQMKGAFETLPATPLDEANHHEHPVRGCHFAFKFKAETRFVERIHQQACNAKRCGRWHRSDRTAVDGAEDLASLIDGICFDGGFLCARKVQKSIR